MVLNESVVISDYTKTILKNESEKALEERSPKPTYALKPDDLLYWRTD